MFDFIRRWFSPKPADAIVIVIPGSLGIARSEAVEKTIRHLLGRAEAHDRFSIVSYGSEAAVMYLWETAATLKNKPIVFDPLGSAVAYKGMEMTEWCLRRVPKDRPYRKRTLLLTAPVTSFLGGMAKPSARLDMVVLASSGYERFQLSLPRQPDRVTQSGGRVICVNPDKSEFLDLDRLFIRN